MCDRLSIAEKEHASHQEALLVDAAKAGKEEQVRKLVIAEWKRRKNKKLEDSDALNMEGWSDLDMENLEDNDAPDMESWSALHLAAFYGHAEVVRLLIENGASVTAKAKNEDRTTVLHAAAQGGNMEVGCLLIDNGASLTAETQKGRTALSYAIDHNHTGMVRLLIQRGAPVNVTKNGMLYRATKNRNTAIARLLLENCASEPEAFKTDMNVVESLHLAIHSGETDIVQMLVEKGASVTATNRILRKTCLHHAVRCGPNEDDPADDDIVYPSEDEIVDMARLLIEAGAPVTATDRDGRTPLLEAVRMRSVAMVRLLIEHGASATDVDKSGNTALHAVGYGPEPVEMARFLIENGASVIAVDESGSTALHRAGKIRSIKSVGIARLLVENGASVTAVDKNGLTVLLRAVFAQLPPCDAFVRFLIEKGASVTATSQHGSTALHKVADGGYIKIARLLIENGASVTAPDQRGITPLSEALRARHRELRSVADVVRTCALLLTVLGAQGIFPDEVKSDQFHHDGGWARFKAGRILRSRMRGEFVGEGQGRVGGLLERVGSFRGALAAVRHESLRSVRDEENVAQQEDGGAWRRPLTRRRVAEEEQ